MDPSLEQALQHPSMVISAGSRPSSERPALKRARGLHRLGAALMLGAALLSPVQAVSARPSHATEQRMEQVVQAEVQEKASAEAKAPGEASERKPSYSSWSPRPDRYAEVMRHIHKDLKNGKEVSSWRWDYHSNTLLTDAYHEIAAGHSVEQPSGRLLDICRQIQKVDQQMPGFDSHPHADMAFATCNAEGMSQAIRADSVKKFAVAASLLGGLLAIKGIASAAQVGSGLYLAGMLSGSSLSDRRQARNAARAQPSPAAQAGPKPPSLG